MENILKAFIKVSENEGIKITQLEKEIGASKGVLSRAIANNSDIQSKWFVKLVENYPQYNIEWLLYDKEPMLNNAKSNLAPAEPVQGIPLLPFDAFAGIGDEMVKGVNFDTIEERYVVPLFDGLKVDFMMPVRGSSMYPKYSSGDVVACRLVQELLFVQWNKVYVVDTISQGIIMKRLLKSTNTEKIICRSDNKDYGDFEVPMGDIRNIALVVGVIRLE